MEDSRQQAADSGQRDETETGRNGETEIRGQKTEGRELLGTQKSLHFAHTRFVVIRAAPVIRPYGRQ